MIWDLAGEIATLSTLEPAALLQKWKAPFGTDPSPLLARIFMVRAIAYRLQERRFGGLKPSTQRLLDRVCEGRADVGRKRRRVSAGTVLIREWGGVSHRVTVLDHGVVYWGRHYKSLSEVAGVITGDAARWEADSALFVAERRAKVLPLNPPTHESARLRRMGHQAAGVRRRLK